MGKARSHQPGSIDQCRCQRKCTWPNNCDAAFSGVLTRSSTGATSDGYYQLTVDGTKINLAGQQLDVDGNGLGGDTYTLGAAEADNFFALYGDTNGDGLVGIAEFGQFRKGEANPV